MNAKFDAGTDYFAVLGVHFGADQKSVKHAYRRMARRYHPDVSKIHNAKMRFQEIAQAYEILNKHRDTYCRAFQKKQQFKAKRRPDNERSTWAARDSQKETTNTAGSQQSQDQSDQKTSQQGKNEQSKQTRANDYGEEAFQSSSYGQKPIHGKDREVVYPITLRYAIRLLRLGSFYIPGLKVQMKFTRQAFHGKTFRLKDKGYKGLFGGQCGDYMVRFNIKMDAERFSLDNGDIYGKFEIPSIFLQPGKTIFIDSPTGRIEWLVPHHFNKQEYIVFREMGLPGDEENLAGNLYAKLIPVD